MERIVQQVLSEKGSTLKGNNLGSKLLPFIVDPFRKGTSVWESEQKVTKFASFVQMSEHLPDLPNHLSMENDDSWNAPFVHILYTFISISFVD